MDQILDDNLYDDLREEDFEFYKNFQFKEDAIPYVELLKENEIPYRLEGSEILITEAIVGSPNFPRIVLKILKKDFTIVNSIIEEEVLRNASNFHEHYLNQYTDHELLDVLKKPDESTIEDITIAKELLKSRGIPIDPSALNEMKSERLNELQKGIDEKFGRMLFYFLIITAASFFLSIFLMIGNLGLALYYWKDKSIDIDGNKYFTYNEKTRNNGLILLILTIVLFFVISFFADLFGISSNIDI